MYIYIHVYIYMCIYICVYICVCVHGSKNAAIAWHTMDLRNLLSPDGFLPTRHLHQVRWCSCRLSRTFRSIHGPSCFRSCCRCCVLQSNPLVAGEKMKSQGLKIQETLLYDTESFMRSFIAAHSRQNRWELSECPLLRRLQSSSTLRHQRHRWSLAQCCNTCNASDDSHTLRVWSE